MKTIGIAAAALLATTSIAGASDMDALKSEAKQTIGQFASQLKGKLQAAMKQGGPVKAIDVCNTEAPEIADSVSAATGWQVARSSHKLRNPSNAADEFTAQAIADFLVRQEAGEKPETLVKAAIVEQDGHKVFRLVKAIPTGEVCLKCHGSNLAPDVSAAIDNHYPQDAARGFQVGEMRGVFTLQKVLD